jgi:hypothetical protein
VTTADPPFVDEHRTNVEASPEVVWRALRAYVDRMLAANEGRLFTKLLGAHPAAGFEVGEEAPERRLELTGRHRFSRYRLVFELEPAERHTTLKALTYAVFPGLHGRAYKLLVIGSRAHVVATRGMLRAVRRRAEAQV